MVQGGAPEQQVRKGDHHQGSRAPELQAFGSKCGVGSALEKQQAFFVGCFSMGNALERLHPSAVRGSSEDDALQGRHTPKEVGVGDR